MKSKIILALLLTLSMLSGASEHLIPRPDNKWVEILGWKQPGAKAYLDVNSLTRYPNNYALGTILLVYTEPVQIEVEDEKVLAKSIIKIIGINCTSGIAAPFNDFYFKEAFPTRKDSPLLGRSYPVVPANFVRLPKSNIVYNTLCPLYL